MGFKITLLSGNHTFTAEAGETIMEAAKKHGHNLPLGCAMAHAGYAKAVCCKARWITAGQR